MGAASGLSRTVVAPLSSAIIALMLAGIVVVGVDQVGETVQPGEAHLFPDGTVEVAVDGGDFAAVSKEQRGVLDEGDRVRVAQGQAVLELPRGVKVELRAGSVVALGGSGTDLRLEAGDLLVESRGDPLVVDGGLARISVEGVAKLRRAVSLAAGVYEGSLVMANGTGERKVGRYRQAAAAGTGILPAQVDPLRLDADDEWDRRILPKVLDLDTKLVRLGGNFETDLPAGLSAGPELFRQVVPGLTAEPISGPLLAGRAPGENLIGLVLVAQDQGGFAERVEHIFGFREQGASWGLVAADRDLGPLPVLDGMEFALGYLSGGGSVAAEIPRGTGDNPGAPGAPDRTGRPRTGPPGTPGGPALPGREPAVPPAAPDPTGPAPPGPAAPNPGGTPPPGGQPNTPPPAPAPAPPKDPKVLDVPPLGIPAVDGILGPVVEPIEDLLNGVLDNLIRLPLGGLPRG